ncbi:spore germination protein GerPB [Gorillibacterium sp. sgz5001074]|uniref:spore germination protein GerPB n=1 Tax=Gorillibacterium sp. sgz5001074 TaxID=3446695 RepID=UPI003F680BEE
MITYVNQSIWIQTLRVNSVTNSSVLQVGSAGLIKSISNNFNTGGFTGPAPQAGEAGDGGASEDGSDEGTSVSQASSPLSTQAPLFPLVPLPALQ